MLSLQEVFVATNFIQHVPVSLNGIVITLDVDVPPQYCQLILLALVLASVKFKVSPTVSVVVVIPVKSAEIALTLTVTVPDNAGHPLNEVPITVKVLVVLGETV